MNGLVDLTVWAVLGFYVFICLGAERLYERGQMKSEARGCWRALTTAHRAAISIALTRERLREGATLAYVRGRAHVDGDVLSVRDGTGVATVPLRGLELFERKNGGLSRLAAITDGSEVVLAGPAVEDVARGGGLRSALPSIVLRATDGERVAAIVLRAA